VGYVTKQVVYFRGGLPMTSFWAGCGCCDELCKILSELESLEESNWSVIDGELSSGSAKLTISDDAVVVTTATASGPQWLTVNVTAKAAGQVLDIMLGCDSLGDPDVYARITFGDSTVTDSCGSVQLFAGGVALEDAQPILGLVDDLATRIVICTDADLSRVFLQVSPVAVFGLYPRGSASAVLVTDADGRLGFNVIDGQSADMELSAIHWSRIIAEGKTCVSCRICQTGWNWSTTNSPTIPASTCEYTVSGSPVYFGLNVAGMPSVDSHKIISELDRDRRYGAYADFVVKSFASATVAEVSCDNGHHVARLSIGAITEGPCNYYSGTEPYHATLLLEILKDDVVIATQSDCLAIATAFESLFRFRVTAWFCNDSVYARATFGTQFGIGIATLSIESTTGQVGDGSDHGASITVGGVASFQFQRCLHCDQCEECNCEDCDDLGQQWQIEIDATPTDYNGTFIATRPTLDFIGAQPFPPPQYGRCVASSGGWELTIERHTMRLRRGSGSFAAYGQTDSPVTDCADVSELEIDIEGYVAGTATVTAL